MPSHLKRYQTLGHNHFVTFCCYQRRPYLDNDHARTIFLDTLERLRQRHQFHIYGYLLMPEHVHLLLGEPHERQLGVILRALKTETSKKLRGDAPRLWQLNYYDFNVFTGRKFREKLRYMHRNPVRRGLVENPEDWPWSSYRHWLTGEVGLVHIESDWTWNARIDPAQPLMNQNWQG